MNTSDKNRIKGLIFNIIILLLLLPLLQQIVGFPYVKPLKGDVSTTNLPMINNWFSGDFQTEADNYINKNFGFRPSFVRLHNQLDYWLFNEVNAANVIVGKEGYLYEYDYISDYLGKNFIGKEEIKRRVAKAKSVSDSLKARNIDLVILLAAGKASFFPEYFPDSLALQPKMISNYDYLSYCIDSAGLNYIDFNSWFLKMKDTSQYALFPKGGIHWSKYGEYLVADSIIRYINSIRNVKLPYFELIDIELSSTPRFRDNDIGEGMNLIFPHSSLEMAYPVLKFAYPHNYDTVKAMVVADSYYWELYNIGLSSVIFDMGRFWYYNKQIYTPIPGVEPVPVEDVNIRHEVEKNDVVFIMQTEATLNRFAFGFFDKQADLYSKPYEKPEDQKDLATDQLRQIINKIKASDEWYELVRKKANNKGISMDEMLKIEAEYIIDQKNKKQ